MRFIIFIFFLPYSAFSDIPSQDIPEKVRSGKKAVWKIHSLKGSKFGTGFFMGPRHFVTNFHVIAVSLNESSFEDIILSQEGNSHRLKMKKIVSVSALHDLAILETEQEVSDYLSLSGEAVPQQEENLYMIGYLKSSFKIMKKTGSSFYQDSQSYTINTNYFDPEGASGSPVLNEQSQVSGVLYQSAGHFSQAIKINHLRNLLEQKTGLVCDNLNPKSCIKSEIENLKKVAKQGHAIAQFNLAVMYDRGAGVAKNPSKLVYWSKQAALQGYVPAQFNLALMYERGAGVAKNPSKAAYWYEKAALQGYVPAQFNLALMYYNGEEVTKDLSKTAYWFEQAALQDHSNAQFYLGVKYFEGEGITENLSKAIYWLEQAANQGHSDAQFNLGVIYYYGEGVKDLSKAAYWLKKAEGHPLVQFNLAKMRSNELQQNTAPDDSLDPCQSAMKK